jgi:hypothetical protein
MQVFDRRSLQSFLGVNNMSLVETYCITKETIQPGQVTLCA